MVYNYVNIYIFFDKRFTRKKTMYSTEYINNYEKKPSCKNKINRRRWEFSAFTTYFDNDPKSCAHFGSRTNINISRVCTRIVWFFLCGLL